jgi:Zn-dependent protease with chaperone function
MGVQQKGETTVCEYRVIAAHSLVAPADRNVPRSAAAAPQRVCGSMSPLVAKKVLAGIILFGTIAAPHGISNAIGSAPHFNIRAQTTCEAKMLSEIDAHEVLSGKAYDIVTEVARTYGRPIPHIYIFPDGWNMAYMAGSAAVDGRGKIVVGQQAIELFDSIALKGFIGHEMAHLVSDSAAQGCKDYIVRDPRVEADADALAARMLGRHAVRAFLERVLVLTEGQNWDVQRRLKMLQREPFN